jgi:hypothetical protein
MMPELRLILKRTKYLFLFVLITQLEAHEPLFGLGPHTMYEGGIAIESELETSDGNPVNQFELLYGITPDWAITLAQPYRIKAGDFGRTTLRTKFRFFRNDMKGASQQAAIHAGISFPESDGLIDVADYFGGLSFGYESRRHYFFASALYRLNNSIGNLERGNILRYDIAYGIRPWLLEYLQPDPVFLIELNGDTIAKNMINNNDVPNSGGTIISLSPGLLFSYRNIMLKTGVKIPIINGLNGSQKLPANEYVLGLEFHFPPIY